MKATLDPKSLAGVSEVISNLGFSVARELKTAVGKTAKKTKLESARQLKLVLPAPTKVLKKAIIGGRSRNEGLSQEVVLWQGHPIPLKHLGARQTKKGISYKAGPGQKGFVQSGFKIDRFGGNAFKRSGRSRVPIEKLYGPSPGEMYEKGGVAQKAIETATDELPKQINERVRFLTLKAQGKLKGKQ